VLSALLNGRIVLDVQHALSVEERGFAYGHGVFETMALRDGRVRFLDDHFERLSEGCTRLKIPIPSTESLLSDVSQLLEKSKDGVIKLIVSRGSGGRGYRPEASLIVTRLALLYPKPPDQSGSISARWCNTRLARNSQLAGIKHLNRLEQVLAQSEWDDTAIGEGLMLDTEGEVVCGTSSNLFIVTSGVLSTPDLRFCGVRGIMRLQVLKAARCLGIEVEERALWPDDVESADELFVTNALRGIRSVVRLERREWPQSSIADRLSHALEAME
jgi:4-amino-4-deoxychorismate lyase